MGTGVAATDGVDGLLRPDVAEDFLTVAEELVKEEGVADKHGEYDHHEVEKLTEAEVKVISPVSWLELDKVVSDCLSVHVAHDVLQHTALEHPPPEGAGHLGETETEGEQEGQPEVVGGDRGVGRRRNLGLVHEASCGLALQMVSYVSCAVDPAVGPEMKKNYFSRIKFKKQVLNSRDRFGQGYAIISFLTSNILFLSAFLCFKKEVQFFLIYSQSNLTFTFQPAVDPNNREEGEGNRS